MEGITAAQMRDLDIKTERDFGIKSIELMENAGKAVTEEAIKMLGLGAPKKQLVAICCGRGNNGGDGIACARFLKQRGVQVELFITPKGVRPLKEELKIQLEKACNEGLELKLMENPLLTLPPILEKSDLIIDALLGTGSQGKPAGVIQKAIQMIMKSKKPVLALDIPSGIDADTGYHTGVFIEAAKTVTLGLPKTGLLKPHAKRYVGELVVVNIGHPSQLLAPYRPIIPPNP